MGYYMNNRGCAFSMPVSEADNALNALKELFSNGYIAGWVEGRRVLEAKTFEDALGECRFEVEKDSDKYDYLYFSGEKYSGNEMDILGAIAPFVEDGSYIEMFGEDGEIWRWVFHKDGMEEKSAKIIWV